MSANVVTSSIATNILYLFSKENTQAAKDVCTAYTERQVVDGRRLVIVQRYSRGLDVRLTH